MKNILKKCACLASLAGLLAGAGGSAHAQVTTNLFNFDSTGQGFLFPSWAAEGTSSFWDSTESTGGSSGAQYVYQDMTQGGQLDGFQCFSQNAYYPYVWSNEAGSNVLDYIDLSIYTNISMDVMWDTTYSSIGINDYNDEGFASPPGNGSWGLEIDLITGASQSWAYIANLPIPLAASNGWTHVNVPIPAGLNLSQVVGVAIKKYTGNAVPGTAALWIDNIAAEAPGAPPPAPTLKPLTRPSAQGLNIYDDGNSGDRQSLSTVVTNSTGTDDNYGWIGNATPVTYSLNIAQAPAASYTGYQVHMMIMPGDNITETAPDWNEANALVLFIERQGGGSVLAQLRYKLNEASGNAYLFGTDSSLYGGSGYDFTNTVLAGYGGLLGQVTNATGYAGTWSVTMTGNTGITLKSPNGSTSTFAFPQLSDAEAFAGPVTVFWGTQPNNNGFFQDVVLSNVAITGAATPLNVDLTQPLNSTNITLRASNSSLIFATPTNAVYWLQWNLPDSGFTLQGAASLTGSWTPYSPSEYTIGATHGVFITPSMLPATGTGFFELVK